jgi:hypothetical protein
MIDEIRDEIERNWEDLRRFELRAHRDAHRVNEDGYTKKKKKLQRKLCS